MLNHWVIHFQAIQSETLFSGLPIGRIDLGCGTRLGLLAEAEEDAVFARESWLRAEGGHCLGDLVPGVPVRELPRVVQAYLNGTNPSEALWSALQAAALGTRR